MLYQGPYYVFTQYNFEFLIAGHTQWIRAQTAKIPLASVNYLEETYQHNQSEQR